jgi:hypothetical protein
MLDADSPKIGNAGRRDYRRPAKLIAQGVAGEEIKGSSLIVLKEYT